MKLKGETRVTVETPGYWRYQDHGMPSVESCTYGVDLAQERLYVLLVAKLEGWGCPSPLEPREFNPEFQMTGMEVFRSLNGPLEGQSGTPLLPLFDLSCFNLRGKGIDLGS